MGQFTEPLNILTFETACVEGGTIRFVTPALGRLVTPEGNGTATDCLAK